MLTYFLIILSMFLMTFTGCTNTENPVEGEVSVLYVEPTNLIVPSAEGIAEFSIQAPGEWTISVSEDWLEVDPISGSGNADITVSIQETQGIQRNAEIVVAAPNHRPSSVIVALTQRAEPTLAVAPDAKTVSHESGFVQFDVSAEGGWTVSKDKFWLTIAPMQGSEDGSFRVQYTENPDTTRSASIIVNAEGHYPDVFFISLTQEMDFPTLEVIPTGKIVDNGSGVEGFSVKSEGDWTVSSDAGWFDLDRREDRGDSYFRVSYEANPGAERSDTITVTAPRHDPNKVPVTFTQDPSPLARPRGPADLRVTAVYWDRIDLMWTDNSSNESGFLIQRKAGENGDWIEAGTVGANVVEFSDEGLQSRTRHYYYVMAYNPNGESEAAPANAITHSSLKPIQPNGEPVAGRIETPEDCDWFVLTLSEEANYSLEVSLDDLNDSEMWLFGPDNREVEISYDDDGGIGRGSKISTSLTAGTFYTKVGPGTDTATGSFRLRVIKN